MILRAAVHVTDTPGAVVDGFFQYGIVGVVVIALLVGIMVPGYLWKAERGENTRLHTLVETELLSAVKASALALQASSEALKAAATALARAEREWRP